MIVSRAAKLGTQIEDTGTYSLS